MIIILYNITMIMSLLISDTHHDDQVKRQHLNSNNIDDNTNSLFMIAMMIVIMIRTDFMITRFNGHSRMEVPTI